MEISFILNPKGFHYLTLIPEKSISTLNYFLGFLQDLQTSISNIY